MKGDFEIKLIARALKKLKKRALRFSPYYRKPNNTIRKKRSEQPFVITIAGDTSLGDNDLNQLGNKRLLRRLRWWPAQFTRRLKPLVSKSDYFILNLETVLENEPAEEPLEGKKYLKWDNPKRTLKILRKLGVTAVTLANNHVMDYGPGLMLQTIERIKHQNIKHLGAGKDKKEASAPLILRLRGEYSKRKIYIINAMRASKRYREQYDYFACPKSPGANLIDKRLYRRISRLRKRNPDSIIIVCPHWQGLDYRWPSGRVLRIGQRFIDSGADFVIGHGAHIMQQIERYKGGFIAYSLGNFVFNTEPWVEMEAPPYSAVARISLFEGRQGWRLGCKFYLIVTNNHKQDYKPRPVSDDEAADAYKILAAHASDPEEFTKAFKLAQDKLGWHLAWAQKQYV